MYSGLEKNRVIEKVKCWNTAQPRLEDQNCIFVINKFKTLNHCFQLKYKSPIHDYCFLQGKIIWSESGEKYVQIKHHLQAKTILNNYIVGFCCERTTVDGLFHWRKHYYGLWDGILVRRKGLKLKCLNDGFVSYKHTAFHFKMLMDWLESCGLLWCFYHSLLWWAK